MKLLQLHKQKVNLLVVQVTLRWELLEILKQKSLGPYSFFFQLYLTEVACCYSTELFMLLCVLWTLVAPNQDTSDEKAFSSSKIPY